MRGLVGACLFTMSTIAFGQGNTCDCQQIVDTCAVSVSLIPTESTKGSYGADLKFTSSAPVCSKVDYYVDGTPYFTILSQGNRGEDRVFGQKPITRSTISEISCRVCRRVDGNVDKSTTGSKPTSGGSQVTMFRPSGERGSAVSNQVLVDGSAVGVLGNGQSVSVNLSPGSHTFKNVRMYQGAWQGECSQTVQIDGVSQYRYEVALEQLVGTTATSAAETACRFVAQ
ncbi:hypothetical protein PCA31118_03047 [Pandoraea captiosa]|uniref:Fimbrial protein n=1 Tax=Pandoraea captiosa TaxID=2508302 RepID=A0A5E5A7M7_9BURK|nr:hypothetical protein PCA31118_03047 [Pandoraea captiosa]